MVTAQVSLRGSWRREHDPPDADQMETVQSDSVGPVYDSIGRFGGDYLLR